MDPGRLEKRAAGGGQTQEEVVQPSDDSFIKCIGVAEDPNLRWRKTMEDAHILENEFGSKDVSFYAIYDGHGGRDAVDFVADRFHRNLLEELNGAGDTETVKSAFKKAYLMTDNQIKEANIMYNGTTAVTVLVHSDFGGKKVLFASNAGDARAVLARGKTAKRITFDHKPSEASEQERVKNAGGFVAYNRVNGILSVSRALGDHAMKAFVISEPFTSSNELTEEDRFVILACDGVWDVISDQRAVDLVQDIDDAQAAAKKIVSEALSNGSTDNISCIVIRFRW